MPQGQDGGYAWVILSIACLITGICTSATLTFGVYYDAWLQHFAEGTSNRQVAAIAALHVGGYSTSGAAVGLLCKRLGFRPIAAGALLLAASSYAALTLFGERHLMVWHAFTLLAGVH